jgi:hypothetical protein
MSMIYTTHKLFFAWDYEKEENWLNSMSAKGMNLVDVGFCRYTFTDSDPDCYNYCLELLDSLPSHPESVAYIKFLRRRGSSMPVRLLDGFISEKKFRTVHSSFSVISIQKLCIKSGC